MAPDDMPKFAFMDSRSVAWRDSKFAPGVLAYDLNRPRLSFDMTLIRAL